MSKQDIIDILVRRDGDTIEDATVRVEELEEEILCLIEECVDDDFMPVCAALDGIAEITRDLVGLEPDYTDYLYI